MKVEVAVLHSWAQVPNNHTVSVDIKQHSITNKTKKRRNQFWQSGLEEGAGKRDLECAVTINSPCFAHPVSLLSRRSQNPFENSIQTQRDSRCFLLAEIPYKNDSCWLECNCRKSSVPATIEEAKAEDKKIKSELTLPTGNLSATVRRKTSATDPRPSAQGVGWLGVSFASALLVAVCILDVTSLKRDLGTLVSNVKDIFSGTKTTQ